MVHTLDAVSSLSRLSFTFVSSFPFTISSTRFAILCVRLLNPGVSLTVLGFNFSRNLLTTFSVIGRGRRYLPLFSTQSQSSGSSPFAIWRSSSAIISIAVVSSFCTISGVNGWSVMIVASKFSFTR